MTLTPVPPGEVATVVTYLAMTAPPTRAPLPASPLRLERWGTPDLACYRALFRRVGAPWLWFSRLVLDDAALSAILHDRLVEVFAVVEDGAEAGLLELDRREAGACALSFVALVPELAGKGHGRRLLAEALQRAWTPGTARVHLQTCTLDHPAALPAYLRAGFTVTGRAVETFPDPRLTGVLDRRDAPQVPLGDAVPVASRR